jgi:hypothetical protein
MNFNRASIVSGNTPILGFKQDDLFIGVEPLANYLAFTWNPGSGTSSKFRFNWDGDFYLELFSLFGGEKNQVAEWSTFIDTTGNPDLKIFYSQFGGADLPYRFSQGILIPPKSRSEIITSQATPYLQLLCKPASPVQLSTLSPMV